MTTNTPTKFLQSVLDYVYAGYQNLSIDTTELERIQRELFELPKFNIQAVLIWDCLNGLTIGALSEEMLRSKKYALGDRVGPARKPDSPMSPDTSDPLVMLNYVIDDPKMPFDDCIIIMRNMHVFMKNIDVAQRWQNAIVNKEFNREILIPGKGKNSEETRMVSRFPILMGTNVEIPKPLLSTVTRLEYMLPDIAYMRQLVTTSHELYMRQNEEDAAGDTVPPLTPELHERISKMLLGLNSVEAGDALSLCCVRHNGLTSSTHVLSTIEDEKSKIIAMSGALHHVKRCDIPPADTIGGWDLFKQYISRIRHCYGPDAADELVDPAKGVVIAGPPGTGKSMVGKITANLLGDLILLIMDVGAIFGSYVGESERKMADTIRTIEAMDFVVVLIDEADKLWGNAHESTGDSGVTRRVFGRFLTWLAEKKDNAFVIMTVNRPNMMPPELLRRGRFDGIYYTDLPTAKERREILEIHMKKRGLKPDEILNEKQWRSLQDQTETYVGSELEDIVKQARLDAKHARGTFTPTYDDLLKQARDLRPLAEIDKENLVAIQEVCKRVGVPVTTRDASEDISSILPPEGTSKRRISSGHNNN